MLDINKTIIDYFNSLGLDSKIRDDEILAYPYLEKGFIDSMGILEMIIKFEKEFKIRFKPEHMNSPSFRTIGGLIELIEKIRKEK